MKANYHYPYLNLKHVPREDFAKSKIAAVPTLLVAKEKEIVTHIWIALGNLFVAKIIVTTLIFPILIRIAVLSPVGFFNSI